MSPRGPAMYASDDSSVANPAHRTRCICGRVFYSTGAQRCIRCRTSEGNGSGAAPPAGRPGQARRIVVRTYPERFPTPGRA